MTASIAATNVREPRKIAIVISGIGLGGGAERVAINLANAFAARDLEVDLVVMSSAGTIASPLDSRVQLVDLGITRLRKLLWPLARYLRQTRPAALLACMWPVATVAIVAKMLAGVETRVVTAEHNTLSLSEGHRGAFKRWLFINSLRLLYPRAQAVVAVSNGVADDLVEIAKIDRDAITTIYNPIVGARDGRVRFEMPESIASWDSAPIRILNVGSLKSQKDQLSLLRAFSMLCMQVEARLLILGEGPLRAKLEGFAKSLGIAHLVSFPGIVPNPEYYYARASLFVLSSRWEGFGNVIVEALDAGLPVVSTDCRSGPREILADGKFGRLVPVGDSEMLAKAMMDALAETPDRQVLKSRAQEFTITSSAEQYLNMLLQRDSSRAE